MDTTVKEKIKTLLNRFLNDLSASHVTIPMIRVEVVATPEPITVLIPQQLVTKGVVHANPSEEQTVGHEEQPSEPRAQADDHIGRPIQEVAPAAQKEVI